MVLTGNPVLVDKEKGVTEGDKLTFHLGDGRILIENKERRQVGHGHKIVNYERLFESRQPE